MSIFVRYGPLLYTHSSFHISTTGHTMGALFVYNFAIGIPLRGVSGDPLVDADADSLVIRHIARAI